MAFVLLRVAQELLKFPDAPEDVAMHKNNIYICFQSGFYGKSFPPQDKKIKKVNIIYFISKNSDFFLWIMFLFCSYDFFAYNPEFIPRNSHFYYNSEFIVCHSGFFLLYFSLYLAIFTFFLTILFISNFFIIIPGLLFAIVFFSAIE